MKLVAIGALEVVDGSEPLFSPPRRDGLFSHHGANSSVPLIVLRLGVIGGPKSILLKTHLDRKR